MASLKNNINNITDDTRSLINDHIKLFSIRQTEKLARFFGLLATIFIISIILLIVIIFFSFALAEVFNNLLDTTFVGYLIISGIYILVILIVILTMKKTKKPLLSNAIARSLAAVFDIETTHTKDLDGLGLEKDLVQEKINSNKEKINTSFQLLRYSLMEHFFKELFGLFNKTNKSSNEKEDESEDDKPVKKVKNKPDKKPKS